MKKDLSWVRKIKVCQDIVQVNELLRKEGKLIDIFHGGRTLPIFIIGFGKKGLKSVSDFSDDKD